MEDTGNVTAEIIQDRLYESDFDKQIKALENLETSLTKREIDDE